MISSVNQKKMAGVHSQKMIFSQRHRVVWQHLHLLHWNYVHLSLASLIRRSLKRSYIVQMDVAESIAARTWDLGAGTNIVLQ